MLYLVTRHSSLVTVLSKHWNNKLFALVVSVPVLALRVVGRVRDLADVDRGEQYKDESLNERDQKTQRHQNYGDEPIGDRREDGGEKLCDLLVREHISEKTYAEREWAHKVAYQFYGEDQPAYPPDRPCKVLQVAQQPVLFNSDVVVIDERSYLLR